MEERAGEKRSLIESILNLTDLISVYVRQQVKRIVDQSIVGPIGSASRKAAFLILAFTLFSLAAIFFAVGFFLLLASLVGYILAYLIIGAVLSAIGAVAILQVRK